MGKRTPSMRPFFIAPAFTVVFSKQHRPEATMID